MNDLKDLKMLHHFVFPRSSQTHVARARIPPSCRTINRRVNRIKNVQKKKKKQLIRGFASARLTSVPERRRDLSSNLSFWYNFSS